VANQQNPNQPQKGQPPRQQSQDPRKAHEDKGGHAGQHGEMPKRNPDAQDPRQDQNHDQGHGARRPDQGGKH
jgi:hypothetical protein